MNTSKLLLTTALVAAVSTPAFAGKADVGKTYVKLSGGAFIAEDIDGTVGATNVKLSFKTGWTASAGVGYWITPELAAEGEVTYLTADFDKGTSGGASVNIDGKYDSVLTMANVNFHPMADDSFDPYIGAGVGVAFSNLDVNSIGGTPVNISDDSTDLALQGTAGFNFALGQSTSVGAQYRYVWTDTGSANADSFTGHALTAHITVDF